MPMSRPKPNQKEIGYVRSPIDEKAARIAKIARELNGIPKIRVIRMGAVYQRKKAQIVGSRFTPR